MVRSSLKQLCKWMHQNELFLFDHSHFTVSTFKQNQLINKKKGKWKYLKKRIETTSFT